MRSMRNREVGRGLDRLQMHRNAYESLANIYANPPFATCAEILLKPAE
jgi:hypothetical protein